MGAGVLESVQVDAFRLHIQDGSARLSGPRLGAAPLGVWIHIGADGSRYRRITPSSHGERTSLPDVLSDAQRRGARSPWLLVFVVGVWFAFVILAAMSAMRSVSASAPASPISSPALAIAPLTTTTTTEKEHIVQSGDTIGKIMQQHGVTLERIAALNDIADLNNIEIGQRIIIDRQEVVPPRPRPREVTHAPPPPPPAPQALEATVISLLLLPLLPILYRRHRSAHSTALLYTVEPREDRVIGRLYAALIAAGGELAHAPGELHSNVGAVRLSAGPRQLFLLPDALYIAERSKLSAVALQDLHIELDKLVTISGPHGPIATYRMDQAVAEELQAALRGVQTMRRSAPSHPHPSAPLSLSPFRPLPDLKEAPEAEDEQPVPAAPEVLDALDTLEALDAQEALDAHDVLEVLDALDTLDTHDVLEALDAHDVLEALDAHEALDALEDEPSDDDMDELEEGATPAEVTAVWGRPDRVETVHQGHTVQTTWTWMTGQRIMRRVIFEDDALTSWGVRSGVEPLLPM